MDIPEIDAQAARDYLEAMYADVVEEHGLRFVLAVYGKRADGSPWKEPASFGGDGAIDEAMQWISERAVQPGGNVYAQMGLLREDLGRNRRGEIPDVAAIPGLWCDVDVIDDKAHKSKKYASSLDDAKSVCVVGGLHPTMMVNSGYGVHGYHLFDEPWVFENENDRTAAIRAAKQYVYTVRANAEEKGFTIDTVGDLVRVLRVPGTINWKGMRSQKLRPVSLIGGYDFSRRYSFDSLDECLIAVELCEDRTRKYVEQVGVIYVHPDAPMSPRVMMLASADQTFAKTWEGKRPDMRDQSPSAYEMSLANQMVAANKFAGDQDTFTDQEIVNTLIAWRRERKHEPKLRVDYYQRTLMRAKEGRTRDVATDEILNPQASTPFDPDNATDEERKAAIHSIAAVLRISIVDIERVGRDPAVYIVVLADGLRMEIGTGHKVANQNHWRGLLAGECKVYLPKMDDALWGALCERIMQASRDENSDAETTQERFRELLTNYFDERFHQEEERGDAQRSSLPYWHDEWVYVNAEDLRVWAARARAERLDPETVRSRLYTEGFRTKKVSFKTATGASTSRSYYRAPKAMVLDRIGIGTPKPREPVSMYQDTGIP